MCPRVQSDALWRSVCPCIFLGVRLFNAHFQCTCPLRKFFESIFPVRV